MVVLLLLAELDDVEDDLVQEQATLLIERPLIPDVRYNLDTYPDANAREDFRFTCAELQRLSCVMNIQHEFISKAGGPAHGHRGFGNTVLSAFFSHGSRISPGDWIHLVVALSLIHVR
jgi:hypothetical protein